MSVEKGNTNVARAKNYETDEKLLVVLLVKKYVSFIESKQTDSNSIRTKNDTWEVIAQEFTNRTTSLEVRTSKQLKALWDNLKSKARKYVAEHKRQMYITGGGSRQVKVDPLLEQVVGIIGTSATGFQNPYDCDSKISQYRETPATSQETAASVSELLEDNENVCQSKDQQDQELFQFLSKDETEIPSWKTWSKASARKPLTYPLQCAKSRVPVRRVPLAKLNTVNVSAQSTDKERPVPNYSKQMEVTMREQLATRKSQENINSHDLKLFSEILNSDAATAMKSRLITELLKNPQEENNSSQSKCGPEMETSLNEEMSPEKSKRLDKERQVPNYSKQMEVTMREQLATRKSQENINSRDLKLFSEIVNSDAATATKSRLITELLKNPQEENNSSQSKSGQEMETSLNDEMSPEKSKRLEVLKFELEQKLPLELQILKAQLEKEQLHCEILRQQNAVMGVNLLNLKTDETTNL